MGSKADEVRESRRRNQRHFRRQFLGFLWLPAIWLGGALIVVTLYAVFGSAWPALAVLLVAGWVGAEEINRIRRR